MRWKCSEGDPWEPRGLSVLRRMWPWLNTAGSHSQKSIRPTDFKVREVTGELEKLVQVQGVTEYTRGVDSEVIQFFQRV